MTLSNGPGDSHETNQQTGQQFGPATPLKPSINGEAEILQRLEKAGPDGITASTLFEINSSLEGKPTDIADMIQRQLITAGRDGTFVLPQFNPHMKQV